MRASRKTAVATAIGAFLGCLGMAGTAVAAPAAPARDDAWRSVDVTFQNYSPFTLDRSAYSLPHGMWASFPPEHLAPGHYSHWRSESDGFATGTEGSADYATAAGNVSLYWDNPAFGSNRYSCNVPATLTCTQVGGDGNNAWVTFILLPRLQD